MRVVQVPVDDVVGVVAVSDRVVPARRTVDVILVVGAGAVRRRACRGIRSADDERVLVDVARVRVVQVPVVEEILMAVVLDGLVAATGPVLVVVAFVRLVIGHGVLGVFLWSVVVFVLVHVTFGGVLDRVLDEIADVRVSKRIEDVLSSAPPGDDALGA